MRRHLQGCSTYRVDFDFSHWKKQIILTTVLELYVASNTWRSRSDSNPQDVGPPTEVITWAYACFESGRWKWKLSSKHDSNLCEFKVLSSYDSYAAQMQTYPTHIRLSNITTIVGYLGGRLNRNSAGSAEIKTYYFCRKLYELLSPSPNYWGLVPACTRQFRRLWVQ